MTETLPTRPRTDVPGPPGSRKSGSGGSLVGTSVPRTEDLALLTGTARFIDDIRLPGMLYAKI
ncbi:MAG: hypothetical protein L0I24_13720, partial [Pseudonocardia sp.]|nr:hypothetical protein [Pseudonocardia sp.]